MSNEAYPKRWLSTFPGFRLPLHLKQMGVPETCAHRSGWGYVMEHLAKKQHQNGIILDDFVERTFQHQGMRQTWKEPWVGIFHHPQNLPLWFDETAPPHVITKLPEFKSSLPWLKGAIALSSHLGQWLKNTLDVPVMVIKHPTEVPLLQFSMEKWNNSQNKQLVQVGWYARNYRGIYQVPVPQGFRKLHLLQNQPWVRAAMQRTDTKSPLMNRADIGEVTVLQRLSNNEYDELLSSTIIFCEYLDVSASNTVIEAIARNTPIVLNRLPANEEYLGANYPLFFEHINEVPLLLNQCQRIEDAFVMLRDSDKSWISGEAFAEQVLQFVQRVTNGWKNV